MSTTVGTLVWIVTFRMNADQPQAELIRYTQESANHFAAGIVASGGVAIVTEDFRTTTVQDAEEGPDFNPRRKLEWPDV